MIIITGVSRGLGKAIAEQYLAKGEKVYGIGRSSSILDSNFTFISCDLSNLDAVNALHFETISEPVTLINNAGIIGNIKRLSDQISIDFDEVMTVNVTSPVLLTQKIYAAIPNKNEFTLVNISSGAANRAIPSWASYCASKAALNMITETFFLEEKEKGNHPKVYAVAPGVIDTGMQAQIRGVELNDFSARDNFVAMKEDGVLFSPEEAANRLIFLLKEAYSNSVFVDLREVHTN